MRLWLGMFFLAMITAFPAFAEEYTYAPEGCDFIMTFPEEPRATQRCHDKVSDKCTLMTSFTKVYDMDAAINIYVSCKPTETDLRGQFTPDARRTSLLARPGVDTLEVYDVTHSENEKAVMSALLGAGPTPSGKDVMVYVTQLWVSKSSVFTMEAELIGHDISEADKLFSDILGSLHHKDLKPENPNEKSEETEAEPDTQPEAKKE